MADDIFLTGPLGTQWNIGSWVEKSAGVDFGAAQLVRQMYGQNAWAEGARLGFESAAGPRRMTFPLIVPSGGVAGLSLDTLEASLRQMVRPGGFVDLRLDGVPSSEAVRFDVLGGDVAHRNYTVDTQRIDRRKFTLALDTQPFGYWPTWIIAGSAASVAMTGAGKLALSAPLGDVPAFAEIIVMPTAASFVASETDLCDGVAWSLSGRPSFTAGLIGGSFAAYNFTTAFFTDNSPPGAGIGGTGINAQIQPASQGFAIGFTYNIPSALEPAYRGRFHTFAKIYSSGPRPVQVALDYQTESVGVAGAGALPMASANTVATVPATLPPVWHVVDLGELTMPAFASGIQQTQNLRLWTNAPSWGATTSLQLSGLYLLPVEGAAGIIQKGVAAGGIYTADLPAHSSTAAAAGVFIRPDIGPLSLIGSSPVQDLRRYHYGPMPYLGATTTRLDVFGYDRKVGASGGLEPRAANAPYALVSVRYRPRFQFLKGL